MNESENFILARDNETENKYLGTPWQVFRDYRVTEKTEIGAHIHAPEYDPGLPQFKGGKRRYSGEWLLKDANAARGYAPLREEPDLFLKFASLAERDPGVDDREGRLEITMEWIKQYGVLGLCYEGGATHNLVFGARSVREENLLLFWIAVHQAADCMTAFQARTAPGQMLKHSNIHGKTVAEKRTRAARLLELTVSRQLDECCQDQAHNSLILP